MSGERKARPASPMRGLLLFLFGVLVGANGMFYVMSRDARPAQVAEDSATVDGNQAPVTTPPRTWPGIRTRRTPSQSGTPAVLPPPVVRKRGVGTPAGEPSASSSIGLLIPVQGIAPAQLSDTFTDARSASRLHDAIDIMAPAGTPVVAVADGHVEKLFDSKLGGLTLYQFNPDGTLAYYYAHLQRYADGLAEGQAIRRGQLLGYVGATGNANPDAPHLHFAIFVLGPEKQWWKGVAVNPYPRLTATPAR